MDLSLSEEQTMLQDSVVRFIREKYDWEKRREIIASPEGWSADYWREMAELGWLAMPFAEADGGLDGGPVDTMVLMEALARGPVVEPFLATLVLSGSLIRQLAEGDLRGELLEALIGGETIFAFAHVERPARWCLSDVQVTAARDGDGYVLNGEKAVVLHGAQAGKWLVSARTGGNRRDEDGISLFLVDAKADGVSMREYPTFDGLRAADITFEDVAAEALIGPEGGAFDAIDRAVDEAGAALCAEAVGAMKTLLDETVKYCGDREQFGQPLSRFQVLRHRMSDMAMLEIEARSMMIHAAIHVASDDRATRNQAVSRARVKIAEAGKFIGEEAVQLHGGMGVTDELPVGDWFRRLTAINSTFGDRDWHLKRLGALRDRAA